VDTTADDTRTMIADDTLPARLAGAYVKWQVSRGWWVALLIVAVVAVVLTLTLAFLTRDATLLVLTAIWLVAIGCIPLASYTGTRRSARRGYPAGTLIEAKVGEDALHVASALGTSEVRFAAFRAVHDRPPAVIIRLTTAAGAALLLPRELFTDADIARLRSSTAR